MTELTWEEKNPANYKVQKLFISQYYTTGSKGMKNNDRIVQTNEENYHNTLEERLVEQAHIEERKRIGKWLEHHRSVTLHCNLAHFTFHLDDIEALKQGKLPEGV